MNEKKNLTTEETFDLAVQNQQKNNLQVAENLYKEILKINPNHFESIFYLGTLLVQTQRFELSKPLLYKATQINPSYAAAHNNLGAALKELGEYEKAKECYNSKEYQHALSFLNDPILAVEHFDNFYKNMINTFDEIFAQSQLDKQRLEFLSLIHI